MYVFSHLTHLLQFNQQMSKNGKLDFLLILLIFTIGSCVGCEWDRNRKVFSELNWDKIWKVFFFYIVILFQWIKRLSKNKLDFASSDHMHNIMFSFLQFNFFYIVQVSKEFFHVALFSIWWVIVLSCHFIFCFFFKKI